MIHTPLCPACNYHFRMRECFTWDNRKYCPQCAAALRETRMSQAFSLVAGFFIGAGIAAAPLAVLVGLNMLSGRALAAWMIVVLIVPVLPVMATLFLGPFLTRYEAVPDASRHCPKCQYNLSGNTTGQCPECGTAFDAKF